MAYQPQFDYIYDHICGTFYETMDSSRIHNDGGDFPGFSGPLLFYTEYMLGFMYDIDPDQKKFPTIYKVFLKVAEIHLREDQGDVHLANK